MSECPPWLRGSVRLRRHQIYINIHTTWPLVSLRMRRDQFSFAPQREREVARPTRVRVKVRAGRVKEKCPSEVYLLVCIGVHGVYVLTAG